MLYNGGRCHIIWRAPKFPTQQGKKTFTKLNQTTIPARKDINLITILVQRVLILEIHVMLLVQQRFMLEVTNLS